MYYLPRRCCLDLMYQALLLEKLHHYPHCHHQTHHPAAHVDFVSRPGADGGETAPEAGHLQRLSLQMWVAITVANPHHSG